MVMCFLLVFTPPHEPCTRRDRSEPAFWAFGDSIQRGIDLVRTLVYPLNRVVGKPWGLQSVLEQCQSIDEPLNVVRVAGADSLD